MLIRLSPDTPDFAACAVALESAGLPTDDLGAADVRLYAVAEAGRPLAFGGLQGAGPDLLLRSVVIPQARRGLGLGGLMVDALLREAADAGAGRVWLLTTDAAGFFDRLGFQASGREAAPESIRSTAQFSGLCPASATLMVRRLDPADSVAT